MPSASNVQQIGATNCRVGSMAKLAFIGLGVMGFPMAGHLVTRGGHDVTVYNRTREKAYSWAARFGGKAASSPEEAVKQCDVAFSCVGNDDDLREITIGPNGAFRHMKSGAVFVDHTTASASVARELSAEAAKRDVGFLDAPVSGGQAGAEAGRLAVMVGGAEADFDRTKETIGCFATSTSYVGGPGSGQLAKMVNQICVAGIIEGLSEALHFAEANALDISKVIAAISKGAAQSWQMENRWQTMVSRKFDFGFAVDWMRKDLEICLDQARTNDVSLPVTALIDQFYADIQRKGGGRLDCSALISRFPRQPKH